MGYQPEFRFDYHPSLAQFAVPKHEYLAARPDAPYGYIATSSVVVDPGSRGSDDDSNITTPSACELRVLLLQRAASDEDPDKWEPPGGACDDDDETVLHAAARELWEEAGVHAARIVGLVGEPYCFTLSDGKVVRQVNFAVSLRRADAEAASPLPAVQLNPEEHQRFLWVTEAEVRARKSGDVDLEFTCEEVWRAVLLAFESARREATGTEEIEERTDKGADLSRDAVSQ